MKWKKLPPRGELMPDGNLYFSVEGLDPSGPIDVMLHPDALPDRKGGYELKTDDEAIEHIMWEHYIRINPDAPESDLPPHVKVNFDRAHGPGHRGPRGKLA